jgi:hypothetical protein
MKKILRTAALAVPLTIGVAVAQEADSDRMDVDEHAAHEHAGDNTARNAELARDNEDSRAALTAEDQSSKPEAIQVTKSIRQKVVADDSLSTYAKNVKIITDGAGNVTLRGPVNSVEERQDIERIARAVAPEARVNNQIKVARNMGSNE